ncbi:PspC domain-containing protein [Paenibacillus sp. 1P07SE]|uniref:PspC domain-containing protein n=1 Tax=Paenibacillus sp. 1P07SE TaxID=3132209 RepID=UPI0039A6821B
MKKLYRSTRDRKLWGICGGISEMTGWDATLLRILLIVGTVLTHGALLFVYAIAGFVIPKSPEPPYGLAGMAGGGSWNAYSNYGSAADRTYDAPEAAPGRVDRMMADMETKAMRKELDELRKRMANYEKGDN